MCPSGGHPARNPAREYYDEYEYDEDSDAFEEDSDADAEEIEEDLETVFFEDECEVDWQTGCPFWILEAEACVGIDSVPLDLDAIPSFDGASSNGQDDWPLWLVEAEAILRQAFGCVEEAETTTTKKLARSGSFQRRRRAPDAPAKGVAAADPAAGQPAEASKTKLTRSGSFQRRRKTFGDASNTLSSHETEERAADKGGARGGMLDRDVSPGSIIASCGSSVGTA